MFEGLYDREKIIINKKMKTVKNQVTSNVTNKTKSKSEVDYKYYKCDYCGKEIKLTGPRNERSGGICVFPASLTKHRPLQLVLHNECLRPSMKVFEGGSQ